MIMLPNVKQSSQEAIDFMEKTKIAKLCLVVPCYNEESILRDSAHKMAEKLTELKELNIIDRYSSVLLVNDGSQDQTWKIISQLHQEAPQTFMGLKLSANRGHQNALLAGLLEARQLADVTISLDADLQDDLDAINEFMSEYYRGSDIVYGVRSDRSSDSFLKRFTAESFYKFMHHLGGENHLQSCRLPTDEPPGAGCPRPIQGGKTLLAGFDSAAGLPSIHCALSAQIH